ncbi:MAG: phosphoribosyl-AMP cyclohydrolase [Candidatus Odinarchaeia archaeon]
MRLSNKIAEDIISKLNFDKLNGLIPIVIQDYYTNKVLMVAFSNKTAVLKSLTTGYAYFYSRTKNKIWKKGETSGHTQSIKNIFVDCDNDTLLFKVEQKVAACHTGFVTCFYRTLTENGELITVEEKVFEPDDVYKK